MSLKKKGHLPLDKRYKPALQFPPSRIGLFTNYIELKGSQNLIALGLLR